MQTVQSDDESDGDDGDDDADDSDDDEPPPGFVQLDALGQISPEDASGEQ